MKLENNQDDSTYVIRSYNDEGIKVSDNILTQSFVITPERLIQNWHPNRFSDLCSNDLELIVDLDPEIIILGSGKNLSFPETSLLASIKSKGIGFEVMDTYAACRCYSILVSEGRNVGAGMILES